MNDQNDSQNTAAVVTAPATTATTATTAATATPAATATATPAAAEKTADESAPKKCVFTGNTATVTLDYPFKSAGVLIETVQVRQPQSGEMRGISLTQLAINDVDSIIKVLPRITTPAIYPADAERMDLADLLFMGRVIQAFLLGKKQRTASKAELMEE